MAHRDADRTMATAAAQCEPTNQRNVIEPANGSVAVLTVGGRSNDRQVARNATDTDIQEAAECQSGEEQHGLKQSIQSVQGKSLSNSVENATERLVSIAQASRGRVALLPEIQLEKKRRLAGNESKGEACTQGNSTKLAARSNDY